MSVFWGRQTINLPTSIAAWRLAESRWLANVFIDPACFMLTNYS
jgi:hypothetical protein